MLYSDAPSPTKLNDWLGDRPSTESCHEFCAELEDTLAEAILDNATIEAATSGNLVFSAEVMFPLVHE